MSVHYVTVDGNNYKVTIEEVSSTEVASNGFVAGPVQRNAVPRMAAASVAPVHRAAEPVAPAAPAPAVSAAPKAPTAEPAPAGDGEVQKAPLQGTVLRIQAKPGDSVQAGDTILILEAMKMENEIVAPKDGVVGTILVKEGQVVDADEDLYELK